MCEPRIAGTTKRPTSHEVGALSSCSGFGRPLLAVARLGGVRESEQAQRRARPIDWVLCGLVNLRVGIGRAAAPTRRTVSQLRSLLDPFEPSDNLSIYFVARISPVVRFGLKYWMIVVPGLGGLMLTLYVGSGICCQLRVPP